MKTSEIKTGTRADIMAYLKATGKHYAHSEKDINEQIDWLVYQGHNLLRLELTELIDTPKTGGCYAQNASENFILEDFDKEYLRLWVERLEDIQFRQNQVDAWEQIVKMERDAEKRDAEFIHAMFVFKDVLDKKGKNTSERGNLVRAIGTRV